MKAKTTKIVRYPNNTFRDRTSSRLSLQGSASYTLGSSLREFPQSIIWIFCLIGLFSFISVPTFALEYSSSAEVNFTISPSISVSVSGDLVIDELAPGSGSDSNVINVNVTTNNVAGYTLTATAGSSDYSGSLDYNANDLVHSDLSDKFTSLLPSDSLPSLTSFSDNTWGYSYSTNNGTSWANYSGLPVYTSAGTTLKEKYIPANDDVKFKIAAKASNIQAAGNYTNQINFTAVGNVEIRYYMQNFTNALCQTLANDNNYTVYDYRDGNDYTVRYINGACWMTQNLRITHTEGYPEGTILGEGSNFSAESISLDSSSYYIPTTNDLESMSSLGYTAKQVGIYYNFFAASGRTCDYCSDTNTTQDICPTNWHLPTYSTDGSISGNIYGLTTQYSPTNATTFSPIYGGWVGTAKDLQDTTIYSIWWASTIWNGNSNYRYTINYKNNTVRPFDGYVSGVWINQYIRCVRTT